MKELIIILLAFAFIIYGYKLKPTKQVSEELKNKYPVGYSNDKVCDMSNTVSPIINELIKKLNLYEPNLNNSKSPPTGHMIIHRRETIDPQKYNGCGCIDKIGNVFYLRLYEWGDDDIGRWNRPIKDIPLDCFSCVDDDKVLLPYYNEFIGSAKIGDKLYLRR